MKSNQVNSRFGQNYGKIWAKLKRNLGKSDWDWENWLDLGKIKILHPKTYSISYG